MIYVSQHGEMVMFDGVARDEFVTGRPRSGNSEGALIQRTVTRTPRSEHQMCATCLAKWGRELRSLGEVGRCIHWVMARGKARPEQARRGNVNGVRRA